VLNFLKAQKITDLYLQIIRAIGIKYYQSFISDASKLGISVHALDGDADYITQAGKPSLDAFFSWLANYQRVSKSNEKFKGIHLDVEPYILQQWNSFRNETIFKYQTYLIYVKKQSNFLKLPVTHDIPFWFDEIQYSNNNGAGNLAEYVIKNSFGVTIMAYRDKGQQIIDIVSNEMIIAAKYGKNVTVAVETNRSSEASYITFYEEGKSYMNQQLSIVKQQYNNNSSFNGLAIHDYNGWKTLR